MLILAIFHNAVPMFIIGRILLGMGIPFAIVAASALIGELSYPKERATLTSLFNASWFIGAIAAAGATLGTFDMPNTWAWRIPSLLQLVPTFFQLAFIWYELLEVHSIHTTMRNGCVTNVMFLWMKVATGESSFLDIQGPT